MPIETPTEHGYTEADVREAFIAGVLTGQSIPMFTMEERSNRAHEYLDRLKDMREKQKRIVKGSAS